MRRPTAPSRRSTLALLAAALLASPLAILPRTALAAGSVTLASREPTEEDGKWKLKFTIDYGSIPQIPHIPMLFRFTPTMLYERALTDKSPEKPIINRMPLQNQQSVNESMDVGFADASGKVFKVTKFDFIIRRDHGFEAGEYDLKITREDDGAQMGQTIKLILKGDNPIVDRRAIVFAGEKKSKKVDADKPADDKKDEKKDEPAAQEQPKADENGGEAAAPPAVPPKQGGCGCRTAGDGAPEGAGLAGLALAAALVMRRRK
jgi:MYXO-CTERM domain-containing protein